MEEKIIDSMRETDLSPIDFITLMFERTSEDGILYIPGWHYDGPGWQVNAPGSTDENDSYRCKIDWNLEKYEKVQKKFADVYNSIKEISRVEQDIRKNPEKAKELLKDEKLIAVWDKYLAAKSFGEFDEDKYYDIADKLDIIAEVKCVAERIAKNEKIMDFEKGLLVEYVDLSVSPEENKYYDDCLEYLHKQSELRIGNNICASDVLARAKRLCRLFALNAPEIIIFNEGRTFAAAFVLHEYGISREIVDDAVRLRLERIELMSEEELDELYRPQKVNTRKSLAPLFVYEILTKNSDSKNHLRQNDILNALSKYPYEISLERKALSRIIHNLVDSANYSVYQDRTGVWVEQEKASN